MASANGHADIVKYLISLNPSPAHMNALNETGNTPLHWAALNGQLEVVKALIASGADPMVRPHRVCWLEFFCLED